jgi:hypothetical protein
MEILSGEIIGHLKSFTPSRRDVHRSFSTTPLSASKNYSVNIPSVNAFCQRLFVNAFLARRAKELFVSFALLHAKENNGRGSAPSCSTHVVPRLRRCKHGAPVQGGRGVQKPQLHA